MIDEAGEVEAGEVLFFRDFPMRQVFRGSIDEAGGGLFRGWIDEAGEVAYFVDG